MCEEISIFRRGLDASSAEEVNEAMSGFAKRLAGEFLELFPKLPAENYKQSVLWLAFVGTGLRPGHLDATTAEVRQWLEERITGFFRAL